MKILSPFNLACVDEIISVFVYNKLLLPGEQVQSSSNKPA
jgi:hypothetical protein